MKSHTHDIYGTNRSKRYKVELTETDHTTLLAKPFVEAARQRMISTFIFSLVIILCTAVIVFVVIQYQTNALKQSPARWQSKTASSSGDILSSFDFQPDTQTLFLLDELREQRIPSSGKEEQPMTPPWIKQAAYHLIHAEKAEREERFDDALAQYAQAGQIFPDMKGINRRVGMLYLKQENYVKAVEALEKVPLEEEITFGLANNLGVTYLAMNEYAQAEKNLLVAIRLNPSYPLAYFNLATLYMRTGEMDKAVQFFEKYLNLKPEDVSAAQTYALILLQLKQWEKAAGVLEKVSRAAPEVAPIHFRLAEAYTQIQNRRGAVDALRRGASLVDPRNALVWMSRPEFDAIRNETGFQELLSELGSTDRP
jgi:tetratricopeptide (TPR) repeat protein